MPEPWCCKNRKNGRGREEEEVTLTPHHTPSQSFDFIVWEKAYLDSIPAAAISKKETPSPNFNPNVAGAGAGAPLSFKSGPHSLTTSSSYNPLHIEPPSTPPPLDATSMRIDGPPPSANLKLSLDKERLVPSLNSPSIPSMNDATLLACRTDADLPPSFFDYKPRISECALTSLEEAVRSYADRHPHAIGAPSPSPRSAERLMRHSPNSDTVQVNVNQEVLLRRSYSQPGGRISKGPFDVGFNRPTASKHNFAGSDVFGHVRIYQDEFSAAPPPEPARNHTKFSCFPTSPGRRKHGQPTLDNRESTQSAAALESPRPNHHRQWQREKLRSSAFSRTSDIHLQQQNKQLSPATWADVMHMRAAGTHAGGMQDTAVVCNYPNSFSDTSSDYHDAAAALNISKLKLWGLHHRFKALCKKFCSICTF